MQRPFRAMRFQTEGIMINNSFGISMFLSFEF